MTWRMRFSLGFVAIAMLLAGACLVETTAVSMTLFFAVGLPLYGLAVFLYVIEVIADLRRHRVL